MDVVLVGGSSRIPRFRRLVKDFFRGQQPSELLRPDHAAAAGTWGLPKIRGSFLGVPIIRTMVFWGLYWGPPILGNSQINFWILDPGPKAQGRRIRVSMLCRILVFRLSFITLTWPKPCDLILVVVPVSGLEGSSFNTVSTV